MKSATGRRCSRRSSISKTQQTETMDGNTNRKVKNVRNQVGANTTDEDVIFISSSRAYNTRSRNKNRKSIQESGASERVAETNRAKKKLDFEESGTRTDSEGSTGDKSAYIFKKRKRVNKRVETESEEGKGTTLRMPRKKKVAVERKQAKSVKGTKGGKDIKRKGKQQVVMSSDESTENESGEYLTDDNQPKYYPITNRCSPNQLTKAIRKLTEGQKKAVRELGFGKILALRMTEIPLKLGHYVVDQFDDEKMAIVIGDKVINIDESSIHKLFGIPNDGAHLDTIDPVEELEPTIMKWIGLYDEGGITRAAIVERITQSKDVSMFFKLDFLVLFLSSIVESNCQGKCVYDPLFYFTDTTDISKVNWCRYIYQKLQVCKKRWQRQTTAVFRGPLTVLTLMYVDSISFKGFEVNRCLAPIAFWTIDMLKEQELYEIKTGGFGKGELIGMSNPTIWPGAADNELARVDVTGEMTTTVQLRLMKEMILHANDYKMFIAERLGNLLDADGSREEATILSAQFVEVFGKAHTEVGNLVNLQGLNNGEGLPISEGVTVNKTTGATHLEGAAACKSKEDVNVDGMNTYTAAKQNTTGSDEQFDILREADVELTQRQTKGTGKEARQGEEGEDSRSHKTDDDGEAGSFSGFVVHPTNADSDDSFWGPGAGRQKKQKDSVPRKPSTDPMLDLDLSVPLAATMFHDLRNSCRVGDKEPDQPLYELMREINKNRLEWLETEDEESDMEDTSDAQSDTSDEPKASDKGKEVVNLADGEPENVEKRSFVVKKENAVTRQYRLAIQEHKEAQERNKAQGLDNGKQKELGQQHTGFADGPSFSLGLTQTQQDENAGGKHECVVGVQDGPSFSIGLTQLFAENVPTSTNNNSETQTEGKLEGVKGESLMKKFFNLPTFAKGSVGGQSQEPEQLQHKEADLGVDKKGDETKKMQMEVRGSVNDGPSFSLGLTQSQNVKNVNGDVSGEESDENETITDQLRRKCNSNEVDVMLAVQKKLLGKEKLDLQNEEGIKWKISAATENTQIVNRYTEEERACWNLIWDEDKRGIVLFDNNIIYISDVNVWRTMQPGKEVDRQIIDCMTYVLNEEDRIKKDGSPKRLFCARETVLNWMLTSTSNNEESRLQSFGRGIYNAVGRDAERSSLKLYDLVFIPVLEQGHYYVMVIELKNPTIYMLDNSRLDWVERGDSDDYFQKSTPYKVKHLMVQYLRQHGHSKTRMMEKCRIIRPKLRWATEHNKVDCGVFAMRHMELFMGSGSRSFACGLNPDESKQGRQINTLRKKYVARMLLSNANVNRELVMKAAGLSD